MFVANFQIVSPTGPGQISSLSLQTAALTKLTCWCFLLRAFSYQLLESLTHPRIVRAYSFNEHELGQALTLEHQPKALRLDRYLAQRQTPLEIGVQLDLMRQMAEAIAFAHEQRVIHRGLNPSSILVSENRADHSKIQITNWQLGYWAGSASTAAGYKVTASPCELTAEGGLIRPIWLQRR